MNESLDDIVADMVTEIYTLRTTDETDIKRLTERSDDLVGRVELIRLRWKKCTNRTEISFRYHNQLTQEWIRRLRNTNEFNDLGSVDYNVIDKIILRIRNEVALVRGSMVVGLSPDGVKFLNWLNTLMESDGSAIFPRN